jgi:uncharacterized membrane protein YhdT
MNKHKLWSRILCIIGLIAMIIGAVDPLEGSLIILAGNGLVALSAFLSKSRHRTFVYWAFGLTVIGVAGVFVVSMFGGAGGNTGRSYWWLLTALPYPVGWIMSLVGVVRVLIESFRKSPIAQDGV